MAEVRKTAQRARLSWELTMLQCLARADPMGLHGRVNDDQIDEALAVSEGERSV